MKNFEQDPPAWVDLLAEVPSSESISAKMNPDVVCCVKMSLLTRAQEYANWAKAHVENLEQQVAILQEDVINADRHIDNLEQQVASLQKTATGMKEWIKGRDSVQSHELGALVGLQMHLVDMPVKVIAAVVEQVVIHRGGQIYYRLSWWSGNHRTEAVVHSSQVGPYPGDALPHPHDRRAMEAGGDAWRSEP